VEGYHDKRDVEPERLGMLGSLAQRLRQGMRATTNAFSQSHAQRPPAIVETSDESILSVDLEGTIATWNRGAEKLFGYAAEEVIGVVIADAIDVAMRWLLICVMSDDEPPFVEIWIE